MSIQEPCGRRRGNPFSCDRCGQTSEGGIHVDVVAAYGSSYDTGVNTQTARGLEAGVARHNYCDACFRAMIPNKADRVFMTETEGYSYQELREFLEEVEHHRGFIRFTFEPASEVVKLIADGKVDEAKAKAAEIVDSIKREEKQLEEARAILKDHDE
jgi:hypothetical protein